MTIEKNTLTVSVRDKDLDQVTGGDDWLHFKQTDKYFRWNGSMFTRNGKYLCPKCMRPVHYGAGCRFYCDPCNCSWWDEDLLLPDPSSGNWQEITEDEYETHNMNMMFG